MLFNSHSNLAGQHSELSASQHSWLRYEVDDLERAWSRKQAARRGDELHEFAANAIRLGQRLEDVPKTLNMYVNDAIRERLRPEQVLYYSPNAYCTADAVGFRNTTLRVWDLKTGRSPVHMDQVLVGACYFILEYNAGRLDGISDIELRIYQGNDFKEHHPPATEILPVIDKIIFFDKLITEWRMEALS